jgi:hypothetical protein
MTTIPKTIMNCSTTKSVPRIFGGEIYESLDSPNPNQTNFSFITPVRETNSLDLRLTSATYIGAVLLKTPIPTPPNPLPQTKLR